MDAYLEPPARIDIIDDSLMMNDVDDHIEMFELKFPPNETTSIEVVPYDKDILKDYYIGDSTRRPNSYFYDEEMKEESSYQMQKETTPRPDHHKDPLPTYKTYTDHYPSTTMKPEMSTTTTTSPTTPAYFPSTTEPSHNNNNMKRKATVQTFFQQGSKQAKPTALWVKPTTPSIKFSTTSETPVKRKDSVPKSSVYQQLGPLKINVTNPSEKSWEKLVTIKPELDWNNNVGVTPESLSTTQMPAEMVETTTTSQKPVIFATSPATVIMPEDDSMINQMTPADFSLVTEEPNKPIKFPKRPTMKPLSGFFKNSLKTRGSFNSGIKWGKPDKDDPIKMSIKRNFNKNKYSTGRRKSIIKGNFRRRTTLAPDRADDDINNVIMDEDITKPTLPTKKPIWTATKQPPPQGITTPGWHMHKNADTKMMKKKHRSEDIVLDEDSDIEESSPVPVVRKKFVNRQLKPQIPQKMSRKLPDLKLSRMSQEQKILNSLPELIKFTAEDAIESVDNRRVNSNNILSVANFENQDHKSGRGMKLSRRNDPPRVPPMMSQKYRNRPMRKYSPQKGSRRIDETQESGWTRERAVPRSRIIDGIQEGTGSSITSYKITPNLKSGGLMISPVRRVDHHDHVLHHRDHHVKKTQYQGPMKTPRLESDLWKLISPSGREFHFRSLQQIVELNQNMFSQQRDH